jgi:alkylglycerol monooxygenase
MQIIAWSIPGFILFIALEAWLARRRGREIYRLPIALADMSCGITSQLFNLLTFGLGVAIYAWVYQHRWFEPGVGWAWLIGIVGVDFLYYWWHRASHEVNFLWAAHIVHHHSEDYNYAVALRQALVTGLTILPFLLPLALLGVPPVIYAACKGLNSLYQFWIHTELIGRLGPLERVLNTPSHHRVHHATNPQYLDKNYGGIVITWDRLFGSFAAERERPVYGTTKPLRSLNPLWANLHRLLEIAGLSARARGWRERVHAWFAHPSWRPAGAAPEPAAPHARYEVRASPALTRYILAQAIVAVPATMLLVLHGQDLAWPLRLTGALLVCAGAVAWAGLFERRRWAWPLELLRVAGSVALVGALVG